MSRAPYGRLVSDSSNALSHGNERTEKIEVAESHVLEELDELDPVARAQVLKGVVESEL